MAWPNIDSNHAHCTECNKGHRKAELTRGMCSKCIMDETNDKVLSRSQNKVVAKASAQFLASMREQGKSGASMPKVFESFWRKIGGEDKFGEMMATEFQKVHGEGLTPEEMEIFTPSPKMKLSWYELISRHAAKTDEGKTLDVGSLEESDLESILSSLAHKALMEDEATRLAAVLKTISNPAHRRHVFHMCLEEDPSLAREVLEANGVTTIDVESVVLPEKNSPEQNKHGEDDYDPGADEY